MQLNNENSQAPSRRLTIAIDGPAAAGKTTIARLLAQRLSYLHLDTGAMYRAVGWKAHKIGIPLNDPERVTEIARTMRIRFTNEAAGNRVIVDSEDVTTGIRTSKAGEWASRVSAISGVRRALVAQQRKMGANGGVVVEGRDIQTVVFPRANVKLFLTASVEERARRRFLELQEKGLETNNTLRRLGGTTQEEIEREMRKRDERDSTRTDSPLRAAPDAVTIDTEGKSIKEVLDEAFATVRRVQETGKEG